MKRTDKTTIHNLTPNHLRRIAAFQILDQITETLADLEIAEINAAIRTVGLTGRAFFDAEHPGASALDWGAL